MSLSIDQMKCPFVSVVRIVRYEWFDRNVELSRIDRHAGRLFGRVNVNAR
jgi:hypothetical protein